MASGSDLSRLGRAIRSTGNPAWLPRIPQSSMHMGIVTGVDLGNNQLDFQFADPSGLIVPGVRILRTYTPTTDPEEGHVVWMQMYGTDPMIVGQHILPTNFVTP